MADAPDANWNPDQDDALEFVERAWELRHEQPEEALRLLERALAAAPNSADVLANAGRFLARSEADQARALELFARAIELDPADGVMLYDAALCAERQGKLERAEVWLRESLRLEPHRARARVDLGRIVDRGRGARAEALELYVQALADVGDDAQTAFSIAYFLGRAHVDLAVGRAAWRIALELAPQDPLAYAEAASFQRERCKDRDAAARLWAASQELEKRDSEVQLRFVRFLREDLEDEERALRVLRDGLTTWPDAAGLLHEYGRVLRDVREDFDGAEAYFSRALEFAPEHPRLLVDAANLARSHGRDLERAASLYRRAMAASPTWSEPAVLLGILLSDDLEDVDAGEAQFRAVLEREPANGWALACLASLLRAHRDDPDQTEDLFRRALAAGYRLAWLRAEFVAFLVETRKDAERAEEQIRLGLEDSPEDPQMLWALARLQRGVRKDPLGAIEVYERFARVLPQSAHPWLAIGEVYELDLKEFEFAQRAYRKAIELDPRNVTSLTRLGRLLDRKLERPDEAEALLRAALAIDSRRVCLVCDMARLLFERRRGPDDEVERLRRIAWEVDPEPGHGTNLAECLLSIGKRAEGLALLDALAVRSDLRDPVQMEIAWFRFLFEPARRAASLADLHALLCAGVRDEGSQYPRSLDVAHADGHPSIELARAIARVIGGFEALESLDVYAQWRSAAKR
jgi:Tfp pilus assembly protein PilF